MMTGNANAEKQINKCNLDNFYGYINKNSIKKFNFWDIKCEEKNHDARCF